MNPRAIIHRQTEAAKARFADVATTPEGDLRVERVAAVVAVVAVVGAWLVAGRPFTTTPPTGEPVSARDSNEGVGIAARLAAGVFDPAAR